MKCRECGAETRHSGTSETLVGFGSHTDEQGREHAHDDNCLKRRYRCENGHQWCESVIRRCDVDGCKWRGKLECFCHEGPKVEAWSDPEDYITAGRPPQETP